MRGLGKIGVVWFDDAARAASLHSIRMTAHRLCFGKILPNTIALERTVNSEPRPARPLPGTGVRAASPARPLAAPVVAAAHRVRRSSEPQRISVACVATRSQASRRVRGARDGVGAKKLINTPFDREFPYLSGADRDDVVSGLVDELAQTSAGRRLLPQKNLPFAEHSGSGTLRSRQVDHRVERTAGWLGRRRIEAGATNPVGAR